jgi:hypothetical protein
VISKLQHHLAHNCGAKSAPFRGKAMLYSVSKMTIKTKSMMRRRVNRARPSGLV